jgi:hypothetical protein
VTDAVFFFGLLKMAGSRTRCIMECHVDRR